LDIIVIKFFSVEGFPLKEALLSVIKVLFPMLFWYCSSYIIVSLPFLAKIFMFYILFCIWNTTLRVPAWRFLTKCTGSLEGVGQPEGLHGREGGPFFWVLQAG
jgi:hypothetical protein